MTKNIWHSAVVGRRSVLIGGTALGLSGCSNMRFPITSNGQSDLADQDITVIRVTSDNIAQFGTPLRKVDSSVSRNPPPSLGRYTYRLGSGDQLQITFYADPGGVTASSDLTPQTTAVVDETGQFFFPFIGKVRASGRTVSQIRSDLTRRLEEFFATPQVEVAVTEFNAHRATITGAVETPGRRTLTNIPVTLLDYVNEVGASPGADLTRIIIRRHGQTYTVNLQAFLKDASTLNNPVLHSGDLIQVPLQSDNKVFTFGEISVGELELTEIRKTLLEVLAESGGIDRLRADARGIFVFRRDDPNRRGFDVYQFDLSNAAALVMAAEFGMAPLDIVFVTNDPATRWSDTVGKVVEPFDSLVRARSTGRSLTDGEGI